MFMNVATVWVADITKKRSADWDMSLTLWPARTNSGASFLLQLAAVSHRASLKRWQLKEQQLAECFFLFLFFLLPLGNHWFDCTQHFGITVTEKRKIIYIDWMEIMKVKYIKTYYKVESFWHNAFSAKNEKKYPQYVGDISGFSAHSWIFLMEALWA